MKILAIKNPRWVNKEKTSLQVDINLEGTGWIPFGADPGDVTAHGKEIYNKCLTGEYGQIAPYDEAKYMPPKTIPAMKAALDKAVQAHLDETAKKFGYDNIVNAISYADEPSVPKYQKEGQSFRTWRSKVWEKVEVIYSAASSGTRNWPNPTEIIKELPQLNIAT